MKPKQHRGNLAVSIISGIVVVFIIVIWIAGWIGYSSFTDVLLEQYSESAYLTANTATQLVDGSKLKQYIDEGGENPEYQRSLKAIGKLCNTQNATFIYVVIPDADYSHVTHIYNTANENNNFELYEIGTVKETTNDDYKEAYRRIFEGKDKRATVIRDTGIIDSGSHITELVPIEYDNKVVAILCVQKPMSALDTGRTEYVWNIAVAMLVLTILVAVLYAVYLNARLLKPIKIITKEAERFARETSEPERRLTTRITHSDEIGILALSIDKMTTETLQYMEHLTEVTKSQQKIATQLDVARQIQQSSLPKKFPAFPERDEFDVYASMTPALEVGGDFYNFFLIDDDHLAMVIADVSDKGVGAALFMMSAKILIENRALMGGKPSEILEFVNNQLCANNDSFMFVTVWLGIMEISTGKVIASNAGHEYPAIKNGDKFEIYNDDPHGTMLGLVENQKFADYTFTIDKKGTLFVYTDGVPDAEDSAHNRLGMTRMTEALNKAPDASPEEIINNVKDTIASFVKDAPRFDDTTVLCVKRLK
ncbi:MAG: SpoIIE family protein phosphatase [Clostridia bacterium]|nr:SpoIIE family protein phosphatase [Clostridia bacterium]